MSLSIHRLEDEVRVFTRNLADVSPRVPEVVAGVRALPATSLILDGEAITGLHLDRRYAVGGESLETGPRQGREILFASRSQVAH